MWRSAQSNHRAAAPGLQIYSTWTMVAAEPTKRNRVCLCVCVTWLKVGQCKLQTSLTYEQY